MSGREEGGQNHLLQHCLEVDGMEADAHHCCADEATKQGMR